MNHFYLEMVSQVFTVNPLSSQMILIYTELWTDAMAFMGAWNYSLFIMNFNIPDKPCQIARSLQQNKMSSFR